MKILPGRRTKGDTASEDAEPNPLKRVLAPSSVPVRPLADGYRVFLPAQGPQPTLDTSIRPALPEPPTEPVPPVASLAEVPAPSADPVDHVEEGPHLIAPSMPRFAGPAADLPEDAASFTPSELDLIRQQALAKAERLLASRGPLASPDLSFRYARDVTSIGADTALRHMLDGGVLSDLSDADLSLATVGESDVYACVVADLGCDPLD